jgi:hypothetical protein
MIDADSAHIVSLALKLDQMRQREKVYRQQLELALGALEQVKLRDISLADAQVTALEALNGINRPAPSEDVKDDAALFHWLLTIPVTSVDDMTLKTWLLRRPYGAAKLEACIRAEAKG